MSGAPAPSRLAALIERSAAPAAGSASEQQDRCGLCGVPIPERHRHVMDISKRELHCACAPCSVLFDHQAAGGRHYRLVPERLVRLDGLALDDLAWRALGLPVEIAFFVRDGDRGRVTAFYPSPAGATESKLPLDAWGGIEQETPALAELEPEVEALLVNRTGGATRAFIAGIDECYRLVAVVRSHWRGFGGGEEVWREIAAFFAELDRRAERWT